MKPHTKIFMEYFGYSPGEFIPCENCGGPSVDIHHLESRGMGGSKTKNNIENLCAVCRNCHDKAHTNVRFNEDLKLKHRRNCLKHSNNPKDLERFLDQSEGPTI